ncbi:hypothetical protein [Peterkaempfera bronchialis]|uniref:hypothetical protein n=1 Tax=Peterkaempfera bronchialis TaxID=2126346 RepID=UPI001E582B3C|nr:hypothetical protein [Peterkaempfera bronchialis]
MPISSTRWPPPTSNSSSVRATTGKAPWRSGTKSRRGTSSNARRHAGSPSIPSAANSRTNRAAHAP